jgi:hypothetical protein
MPLYTALNTQIDAIKSEITASLNASTYTAQDLVYVAKAIETLGNLLGINDLAAASVDAQDALSDYVNAVLDGSAAAVAGKLYVGTTAEAFETSAGLTNALAVFKYDDNLTSNSFAQIAFTNDDASSSADIQLFMNNGTDASGWIDLGITGSAFADPEYPITYAGDGYLFVNGKPSYRGNLVFGTGASGTQNKIIFAAGGYASGNTQMTIIPDTRVHVEIDTESTSPTTGALTVAGGLGVTGSVNIGGDVNINGTISFSGGGTTVETDNIAVVDPMIYVASGNAADLVDGAFVVEYTSSGTKYSTLFRDASDSDIWKFASNITTKPTTTVNTAQAGLAYDVVYAQAFRTSRAATANDEVTQKLYVDNQDQDNFVSVLMGVLA